MSSGPVGLDAREYSYDQFSFTIVAGGTTFSTLAKWLVTKISIFADAEPLGVQLVQPSGVAVNATLVEANGCLELEPNGAFRGDVAIIGGLGALVLIEYWFQAQQDGFVPTVDVT